MCHPTSALGRTRCRTVASHCGTGRRPARGPPPPPTARRRQGPSLIDAVIDDHRARRRVRQTDAELIEDGVVLLGAERCGADVVLLQAR